MIVAAEPGRDLLEGTDVLAGLTTVDHGAFGGVSDSHHEDAIDCRRHLGHAGGGDGIAIADEEEGRGVGRPVFGDFGRFFESIEESGFADGKDGGHVHAVEEVEDHFEVAAFLYDGFGSVINGDHGDVEFVIGGAFEEGLDQTGGALRTRKTGVLAGVLKFHGGRDIEDEEEVAPFLGLDRFDFGAMGLGFEEKEGGESPGEAAEEEDAKDGSENRERGEATIRTKGEVTHFLDPTSVEEFGAGREKGGGDGD